MKSGVNASHPVQKINKEQQMEPHVCANQVTEAVNVINAMLVRIALEAH